MNDERKSRQGEERDEPGQSTAVAAGPERASRKRRPYQRPVVEKRRSLIQATLLSGGVSGGSGPSGSGG